MKIDANTVIFITGGGSGFGLETAKLFYTLGTKIVLTDIRLTEQAEEFVKSADTSRVLIITSFDVTNENKIKEGVQFAIDKFGHIDILMNSAGIADMQLTLRKNEPIIKSEMIRKMLMINVVGTINTSKYVAQHMIKQKRGVIINLASNAALDGTRGMTTYAMTKGAVIGITLPMARDLGRYNIRVVTLAPSVFETPMGNSINDHPINQEMKKQITIGRLGHPTELADSIQQIVECDFLNGNTIRIDGGIRTPHL